MIMHGRHILSLLAIYCLIFISSCGPGEPKNPYDPLNPNYQKPFATIISGPQDDETLDQSSTLFAWEGNNEACYYSYKIAYASQFNTVSWSEWTSATSVILSELDEESYLFAVKARYPSGDEQPTPSTRQFIVNAYREPSLLIKPCSTTTSLYQQFTVEVTAEEMTNLMAAKIVLLFTQDILEIVPNGIVQGDFLIKNGGEVVFFDSVINSQGRMEIDLGIAEGDSTGVSGNGTLAKIIFRSKIQGTGHIDFDSFDLRDVNNQIIEATRLRNGKAIIE